MAAQGDQAGHRRHQPGTIAGRVDAWSITGPPSLVPGSGQDSRRNWRIARGANTAVRAAVQARVWSTGESTGPPSSRPRRASVATVIGLTSTKGWSQPGIVSGGANTELAKMSGNIQMNPADWAVSGLRTDSPIRAATHDRAMPKPMISTNPARAATGLVVIRKPSTTPTVRITSTVAVRRT